MFREYKKLFYCFGMAMLVSSCGPGIKSTANNAGNGSSSNQLNGTWTINDLQCNGSSILPASGFSGTLVFNNLTGSENYTMGSCAMSTPLTIGYPSSGQYSSLQSGTETFSPSGCSTSSFDPAKAATSNYSYSINGSSLNVKSATDSFCTTYGFTGNLTIIATKQ